MSDGKPGRKPRVSDEEILDLFRHSDDPVLSTADIAEQLPIKRRGTLKRLRALVEAGQLKTKPIGGRNNVWWLDESDDIVADRVSEPVEESTAPEAKVIPRGEARDTPDLEQIRMHLLEIEFPATKDPEACQHAVAAAYAYLREQKKATMRQFVQDVMPEHPVGYDIPELEEGDRYRGSWWRKVVKPGLEALPDVQNPQGDDRWWRYDESQ